jgi:hypothetical protein
MIFQRKTKFIQIFDLDKKKGMLDKHDFARKSRDLKSCEKYIKASFGGERSENKKQAEYFKKKLIHALRF